MTSFSDYSSSTLSSGDYRTYDSAPIWHDKAPPVANQSRVNSYRRIKHLKLVDGSKTTNHISARTKPSAVAKAFKKLTAEWRAETAFLSDPTQVILHPAYQRIIGLGHPAVPLVVNELVSSGGDWFWALRFMTGAEPVQPTSWGNFDAMRDAWVAWWAAHQAEYI